MGGVVSSGHNNDDLIDNLLEADYIKSSIVEKVFRAVDRAEYFLAEARGNAYKDLAWKCGNLHLSAPCIYSEVMEGLCLEPGLSFLNLGSGTGYLSTMVGLVLGSYGINHGVEYHDDVVLYANKKLDDFRKFSGALDEFDYCEPKFIQGNCLCLTSDCHSQYDRVYCGAACPEQYDSYMKNLLKIGGILVMPLNDQLLQVKRTSDTNWEVKCLLPVSFATLIQPKEDFQESVQMVEVEPLPLQGLCRAVIRNIMRKNYEIEHPVKKQPTFNKAPKKKRVLRRLVVPLFESEDSSDEDRHVRIGGVRNRDAGRAMFREESDGLLNFVLGTFREGRNFFSGPSNQNSDSNRSEENQETEHSSEDNRMETDTLDSTDEVEENSIKCNTQVQTQAVIEHNPTSSQNRTLPNVEEEKTVPSTEPNSGANNGNQQLDESSMDSINEIHNVFVDVLNVLRRERGEDIAFEDIESDENNDANEESDHVEANESQDMETANASCTSTRKKKREKFDSGLGDEIVEQTSDSSDDDQDMKLDSSDDEDKEKRNKRVTKAEHNSRRAVKCSIHSFVAESSSDNDNEEEVKVDNEMKMYESPYTEHMKAKIQELPLPPILKRYLNFCREF